MKSTLKIALIALCLLCSTQWTEAQIIVLHNISCMGNSDGQLTVVPNFGTGPYTYSWSTGAGSQTVMNLVAGNYSVTVTDALFATMVYSETLVDPSPITITLVTQTNVLCFGAATGSLDVTVAGGTGAYLYNWSNGAVSEDISNISGGTYTLVVTDANGCVATANYIITEPALPLQASITSTDVNCFGENTGSATANPVGGTGTYSYVWNTGALTPTINALVAGNYTVTVTDANLCTASASVMISEPSSPVQATLVSTNVSCFAGNDGTATVTNASGGTGPLTYLWSTGAFTSQITGLTAGLYTVTITDANGCQFVGNVNVTQPAAALSVTLATQTNVLCFGASTGAINVNVAGGTLPYLYNWSNGAVSQDISNVPAGTYTLIVADANGCTANITRVITQPATVVSVLTTSTNVTCFGGNDGTATATGIGGNGPLTYLWSTGTITPSITNLIAGNYLVTVTDANGCTAVSNVTISEPTFPIQLTLVHNDIYCAGSATGSASIVDISGENGPVTYLWSNGAMTPSITNILAGNYTVTVTDANLCTATAAIVITEPLPISIVPTITPSDCDGHNNGAISLVVNGGVAPYVFSWKEINFDSTYTTQNIVNVRGGTYALTITDFNGCMYFDTLIIPNLAMVPVNIVPTSYVCNGSLGSVSITAPGADVGVYYTYAWSSAYTNGSFTTNDSVFTTSPAFVAGTYSITVTDPSGCAMYYDSIINQSAAPLVVNYTVTHNTCYENTAGSIQLFPSGGDPMPGYHVTWIGPNGFASTAFSIGGLAVGDYTYTVTDDSVCSVSGTIRIEPLLPIQGYITSHDVLCSGGNTGSAEAFFGGGTGLLNYLWSNGATTPFITNVSVGTYTLTVTDSVGCSVIDSVVIRQPNPILVTLDSLHNVSCYGETDGGIWITTNGGSGTLSYTWLYDGILFPQVTEDIIDVPAGVYQVSVFDTVGCIAQTTFTITQPAQTLFVDSVHTISCNNGADGYWQIEPIGPDFPYVAIFSTGDTISTDTVPAPFISGLTAGNYSVTFTSILGCTWMFSLTLEQPLPITVGTVNIIPVICYGDSTGSITLDAVHGGTSPYTFAWSNGAMTQNITNIPSGTYNLTITDVLGCNIYETYEVEQPYEPIKFFTTITSTVCQQSEDGQVVLYTEDIYWSPFSNTFYLYDSLGVLVDSVPPGQIIDNLPPGPYLGILINENGCTATDSIYVDKGTDDCIIIPNLVTINDDGYNDVFKVQGGCEYDTFVVQIFTDWGEQVFESSDCAFTWDPKNNKAAANSVYYYYIAVTENGKLYQFKSSINIQK